MIQGYPQPEKGKYKVYVHTITYNHSEYIVDTFNGVAMQQTSFPFVQCVYDDCSTDGEQDVIKKWLAENCQMDNAVWYDNELAEIVEVEHNSTPNLTVVVYFFKRNLYKEPNVKRAQYTPWQEACEYEALCEGDDYWMDPMKLQKQVDILDSNPECTLVLSNGYKGRVFNKKARLINPYLNRKTGFLNMRTLLMSVGGLVPTASMCFRREYMQRPEFFNESPVGDKPIRIWCALNGSVFYFKEPMTFYRTSGSQTGGSSFSTHVNTNREYAKKIYDEFCLFLDRLNEYTSHQYVYEISFMKDKEEFYYLSRIRDREIYKCNYLRHPACPYSRIRKLKLLLSCKYPKAYSSVRGLLGRKTD